MVTNQCSYPGCSEIEYMQYISCSLCASHWCDLCKLEGVKEKKWLTKIGLTRDLNGLVVERKA